MSGSASPRHPSHSFSCFFVFFRVFSFFFVSPPVSPSAFRHICSRCPLFISRLRRCSPNFSATNARPSCTPPLFLVPLHLRTNAPHPYRATSVHTEVPERTQQGAKTYARIARSMSMPNGMGLIATESTKGILCVGNKKSGVSFCDSLGLHYFCAQNKP